MDRPRDPGDAAYAYPITSPLRICTSQGGWAKTFSMREAISSGPGATSSNEVTELVTQGA